MQKIIRFPILILVVILSGFFVSMGCGGSSSTATDDGTGTGDDGSVVGGGEGGSVPEDSDPLRQFSLSNVSLDPESLLVTNSTRTLVSREGTTDDDYSYEDWSMVGYAQEMIQDEVSWNGNKINAELRLFDWGLNQEILSGMPETAGEYVYAHIIWPAITETDIEESEALMGEYIDVFDSGIIERYYRYSRAEDDTWQVEICNADENQFLQYDRLVDVDNRTIDTSAIYSESFVLDSYEVGGTSSSGAGAAAMSVSADVSAGENQIVWSFLVWIDDNRVLVEDALGEVGFDDIVTATQTAYVQDSYANAMAEIALDNTDTTQPYNTVRGYYDASFSSDSTWTTTLTAVNGFGSTYSYEGIGTVTFTGTEPAMDMSWFCSDLTGTYACANWDADWETMATDCADFWMNYDGTCTDQEELVMECFALVDNSTDTTCELDEEYTESYYMADDTYGYPEFYRTDAVSNSALSDTLATLTDLSESDLVTVEISRTWDCTATAWDVDEDMSDEVLPEDVADAFALAYGMMDHADPTEAQSGATTDDVQDQCTDCGYVEEECYDAECYCAEATDDPFCQDGGEAYCELYPDDPSCSDGGYDYCDLYPDDSYCTGEGGDIYCEEACASLTGAEYDLCVMCCVDSTLPECTY